MGEHEQGRKGYRNQEAEFVEGRQKGWSDSEKGWRRGCLGREVEMGLLGES